MIFRLPRRIAFPDPALAEPDGLLAVGGDLSPERLVAAYAAGIFPWYSEGEPILWWSPDPRWVLRPEALHVSRSLQKRLRRGDLEVTCDRAFDDVMGACALPREGQRGTWITRDMRKAYGRLHAMGVAHSVETWSAGELVGGLYGVSVGTTFFGESMFARVSDASKVAFARLVAMLKEWGFALVDCQVETEHLASLGATPMPRQAFLAELRESVREPTRRGPWRLE